MIVDAQTWVAALVARRVVPLARPVLTWPAARRMAVGHRLGSTSFVRAEVAGNRTPPNAHPLFMERLPATLREHFPGARHDKPAI